MGWRNNSKASGFVTGLRVCVVTVMVRWGEVRRKGGCGERNSNVEAVLVTSDVRIRPHGWGLGRDCVMCEVWGGAVQGGARW